MQRHQTVQQVHYALPYLGGPLTRLPAAVPADGNCLFHALSTAIAGDTSLSTELRVRTCIEMVVNKDLYEKKHKNTHKNTSFKDYFIKIAEKIRSGVFQARLNNKWIPIDWKNNSCESMNHIIKLSTNWTGMKLPALVDRLYRIVKLQQIDCRRALYGEGNYELAPWMKKLKVSNIHWKQKTEEEKEQVFRKFMKGLPERKRVISSTDGLLSVPRTPKIARKPGQRKRVKNIRTRTKL